MWRLKRPLYEAVWRAAFFNLLDAGGILGENFGEVFCDFRGLIVGDGKSEGAVQSAPINGPYKKEKHLRGEPSYQHDPKSKGWAAAIVKNAWPLLCRPDDNIELTVSRFLDGRALYISALGSPHLTKKEVSWNPILYYLHFSTEDPFQIGRLVDRLHFLGMMRLAALFQINDLQKLNFDLDKFEQNVAELRSQVPDVMPGTPPPPHSGVSVGPGSSEQIATQSEAPPDGGISKRDAPQAAGPPAEGSGVVTEGRSDAEVLLALRRLIASGNEIEKHGNGRLPARVERSLYYINKFKSDIVALRIQRLEGYQPYDEFVIRRLGGSFLFIEMIGERLTQHARNMQTLAGYVTALSIAGVMGRTELLTASNVKLAFKMRELNEEIDDIQDIGEIVLFAVIAPHYFADTINSLARNAFTEQNFQIFEEATLMVAVFLGVSITLLRLFLGVAQKYESLLEEREEQSLAFSSDHAASIIDESRNSEGLLGWCAKKWASFAAWRKDPEVLPSRKRAFYIKALIVFGVFIMTFSIFIYAILANHQQVSEGPEPAVAPVVSLTQKIELKLQKVDQPPRKSQPHQQQRPQVKN